MRPQNRRASRTSGMLALVAGLGASALSFGQVQTRTVDFATDPGWIGVRNIEAPRNFGFNATANFTGMVPPPSGTASGPGEVGGQLTRSTPTTGQSGYYADAIGPITLSDSFTAKGVFVLPDWQDKVFFGFFDSQPRREEGFTTQNTSFYRPRSIGLSFDARSDTGGFSMDGYLGSNSQLVGDGKRKDQTFASIGNGTRVVTADPEDPNPPASGVITPYQFEMTYTPNNENNTGTLAITVTDTEFIGTNPIGEGGGVRNTGTGVTTASGTFDFNLTSSDRDIANTFVFDRFGLWSFGGGAPGPSSVQSLFLDDVTYTSQIPEPASLCGLGLASLFALRRARRQNV